MFQLSPADFLDITLVAFVLYAFFFWFKKTKAVFVFTGFVISSFLYLVARELKLHLITALMQGFFAVVLVAIVVIFQEEIRRFFEQIAMWSLNPRLRKKRTSVSEEETDTLVRTVTDLAKEKTGAILVLRGRDPIRRHLYGGVELQGILSEALLKSIFDPHSAGHDGAVVIEGGRVAQFASHLPLSRDLQKIKRGGTRHAAALGLAELTDALCLVVSEERGTISAARDGKIDECDEEELRWAIRNFYAETVPGLGGHWNNFFKENLKEKFAAVFLALVLWFVFVHESVIVYKSFKVPVEVIGLPRTFAIKKIEPIEVKVIFSGARRDYYFVNSNDVRLFLKLFNLADLEKRGEGTYEAPINPSDLTFPSGLSVENVIPRSVQIKISSPASA
ncbi:MAG: DNA integrity scanning protein DisA nucleotide-binding domain protein [Candidatus Omnitrophica bacterium]|nr:DNA integrity scanning protein DisA nucleotide-binding domain protein [Candidatus Omnitrophota bacterium]